MKERYFHYSFRFIISDIVFKIIKMRMGYQLGFFMILSLSKRQILHLS